MSVTKREELEAEIAARNAALEELGRNEAMESRQRASRESLTAIRSIVESQRRALASLDAQVSQHFELLVTAVEGGHEQVGHFYQPTASGQRSADIAATALKNIVAARHTAKVQLAAHERRLEEQEAALSK